MEPLNDPQRQRRIEAFVSGRMQGLVRDAFELAMTTDLDLCEAVEIERTMQNVLRHEKSMRFRDLVKEVSDGMKEPVLEEVDSPKADTPVIPISRKRSWTWLAAAASVALMTTIGWWVWVRPMAYDQLAMNVTTDYHFSTTRGGGAPSADLEHKDQALTALLREPPFEQYLLKSAEALEQDSAYAVRFGRDVRRDRALLFLRLKRTEQAREEAQLLGGLCGDCACDAAVIEGLSFGIDGDVARSRERLLAADRKGCLDERAKVLLR